MIIFKNNNSGFTLIELIVSIAIIGTISGIMLANYHSDNSTGELNIAAQNLVSEIRKAQAYALGYKEYNGAIQSQGGWGIRLTNRFPESENFILFFDVNNSGKYDGSSEVLLDMPIGKNIKVSKILFDGVNASNFYFWAIFYPPDPKIMLRGSNNSNSNSFNFGDITTSVKKVEIELSHANGTTKSIILNRFGLIDVN